MLLIAIPLISLEDHEGPPPHKQAGHSLPNFLLVNSQLYSSFTKIDFGERYGSVHYRLITKLWTNYDKEKYLTICPCGFRFIALRAIRSFSRMAFAWIWLSKGQRKKSLLTSGCKAIPLSKGEKGGVSAYGVKGFFGFA
jgi:hypothetical protein